MFRLCVFLSVARVRLWSVSTAAVEAVPVDRQFSAGLFQLTHYIVNSDII